MHVTSSLLIALPTTHCDRFRCRADWTRSGEESSHPTDHELWFIWAGHGTLNARTGEHEIKPGFCAWFRPGDSYQATQDRAAPLGITSIHFQLPKKHADVSQYPEFFDVWDLNYVDSVTQRIVEIMRQREPDEGQKHIATLLLSGVLLDVIGRFSHQSKAPIKTLAHEHRAMAGQFVQYIHDSTGTPVTVADLARKAGYSVAHFSLIFKQMTGQTAESMIVQARIDKARRLLRWSNNSISEVAAAAGYPDVYFFSRQFKLKTGLTPTAYRSARHEDRLELLNVHAEPLLFRDQAGTQDVKHGFETGRVVKQQDRYHLFVTEFAGDPKGIHTRLAHWTSQEGLRWSRVSTLFESSGNMNGTDRRAALAAPTPVYDPATRTWHLFYVAYRAAPNTAKAWLNNHEGRVWHAVSTVTGPEGIGGPYQDRGVVLEPDHLSQSWEGLKGVASFFPYRVGEEWYAFYGSAKTEHLPCDLRAVGLAKSARIEGPWKRLPKGNPVLLDEVFTEYPSVAKLPDGGGYLVLFDGGHRGAVGYSFSADGIHWQRAGFLLEKETFPFWLKGMRSPVGAILEEDACLTIFYTGYDQSHYANLGIMQARVLTDRPARAEKTDAKQGR